MIEQFSTVFNFLIMHSIEERVFVVEHYFSTKSYAKCQKLFTERFPNSPVPSKSTINRTVNNFKKTGSVHDKVRHRKSTVLTSQKLTQIAKVFEETPSTSLSKLQQQCDLSYGSARRATKQLNLHAYKCNNHKGNGRDTETSLGEEIRVAADR